LRSSELAGAASSIAPETDAGTLTYILEQVGALTWVGGATPTIVLHERAAPLIADLKARMRAELTTPPNAGSTHQSMRRRSASIMIAHCPSTTLEGNRSALARRPATPHRTFMSGRSTKFAG
jgi:hypothetical protein